jgi:hypothetical protein
MSGVGGAIFGYVADRSAARAPDGDDPDPLSSARPPRSR